MSKLFADIFPAPEVLVNMGPEEVAGFLLEYLIELPRNSHMLTFNNLTTPGGALEAYAGQRFPLVAEGVAEALTWLFREGLIAFRPGTNPLGPIFVTRRGRQFKSHNDLAAYRRAALLHEETLDGSLAERVVPAFRRGDYETAIFAAFKEVEVRVRNIARLPEADIGVNLMRTAFKPEPPGPLADAARDRGERVAVMETFAGAVGMFKNPSSHRRVEFNADEAATLIHFANYLLQVAETRRGPE